MNLAGKLSWPTFPHTKCNPGPITGDVMKDPVICSDGHTYEVQTAWSAVETIPGSIHTPTHITAALCHCKVAVRALDVPKDKFDTERKGINSKSWTQSSNRRRHHRRRPEKNREPGDGDVSVIVSCMVSYGVVSKYLHNLERK